MLKKVRERVFPLVWPALIGVMLALGLMLPVFRVFSMHVTAGAVWACALTGVVCAASGIDRRYRLAVLVGGGILLVFLAIAAGMLSRLGGIVEALIELAQGNVESIKEFGLELAVIAGTILTLTGWALAKQSAGFFPALSLALVSLLIVWFSGGRDVLWLFTPALVALCALFARSINELTPYPRVIALAVTLVLMAMGMSSAVNIISPPMEKFADQLRNYIADTLFFTEPRKVYTIFVDGYKPLEVRLGGKADVQDRPVMTVQTPTTVMLRGSVYNEYTGLSWRDTLSTRRYLYMDPRQRGIRADVMDEDRPDEGLRDPRLFRLANIKVTMQSNSASTLFVPLRAEQLDTPMEMVPYFNTSSEIFTTRDLEAKDTYSLTAPIINPGDAGVAEMLSKAAVSGEYEDMSAYMGIPNEIADTIRVLAQDLTADADTPLEKALAIQNYLKTTFRYTLSPSTPPDNQDFVSYFIIKGREGYCTYFASAMAVLGRLAGLPTRYVEGYLAQPAEGLALVSSKNAHAWVEVYFDGFGWLPFDATPADPSRQSPDNGQDNGGQDNQDNQGNQGEQPNEETADPSNSGDPPEGERQEDQTPPPDENNNPEATLPPDENATPTPPPPPTPTPPPTPSLDPTQPPQGETSQEDDNPPQEPPENKSKGGGWIWFLILLFAAGITWRAIWTKPEFVVQKRRKKDDERLLTWYRGILGLLSSAGMGAKHMESPVAYAMRLSQGIPESCGLMGVADAVTHLGYGRFGTGAAQVEEAKACYKALHKFLPFKAKVVWFIRRMLKGIGGVKQMP